MRTKEEYENVKTLLATGLSQAEIARKSGIPRGTIRDWIKLGFCPQRTFFRKFLPIDPELFLAESEERSAAYAFILGEYLGDGYIRNNLRSPRLCIFNDKKYETLNQLIESELQKVFPLNKVNRINGNYGHDGRGCWEIYVYSNHIPILFPQMGQGRKHERKIELLPWQLKIVDAYPKEFIRGLFYSDGCIYEHKHNNGKYSYRAYQFVNKSEDIIKYLCESLNKIGVVRSPRFDSKRLRYIINIYNKKDREILAKFMPSRTEI